MTTICCRGMNDEKTYIVLLCETVTCECDNCFDLMNDCINNGGILGNLGGVNFDRPEPEYGFYDSAGSPLKSGPEVMEEIGQIMLKHINATCCNIEQVQQNHTHCNHNIIGSSDPNGSDVHITVCFPNMGAYYEFEKELYDLGYCHPNHNNQQSVALLPFGTTNINPQNPAFKCVCITK